MRDDVVHIKIPFADSHVPNKKVKWVSMALSTPGLLMVLSQKKMLRYIANVATLVLACAL